jgi:hypothetical protein
MSNDTSRSAFYAAPVDLIIDSRAGNHRRIPRQPSEY